MPSLEIFKIIGKPATTIGIKLLSFFKKKVEKKYPVYATLRSLGIAPKGDNIDVLYNETLYELEHSHIKHPLVIELFKEPSAKISFTYDLLHDTENRFLEDLQSNLAANDKYLECRSFDIDLVDEINNFLELFTQRVQLARNPHQVEVIKYLKSIDARLPKVSADTLNLSEHIQELEKLRGENKHEAVKTLLLNYKNDKWATLSNDLKYKLTAHLGITFFELGDKKEGARYFTELLQYQIKLAESYSLAALGYALLGNEAEAEQYAEKSLELDSKNVNAYLAKLFVRGEQLTADRIYEVIPKEMREVPIIAINIATSLERNGEIENAFAIFSKLEQDHTEMDSFRCDILTQLAVNRIHSLSKKEDYQFDQLNDRSKQKLNQALEYLTTVWDYFKHTDLSKSRSYVLANRGVVYKALMKNDLAERDLLASLELQKTYFACAHLFEVYSGHSENFGKILAEVKSLSLSTQEKQQVVLLECVQNISNGETDTVLSKLISELPQLKDSELLNKYYTLIVDLYLEKERYQEAEQYAQELIRRNPEDPWSYIIKYKVSRFQNDVILSKNYLHEANSLSGEQTANVTLWELANIMLANQQYTEAAVVLRKAADTEVLSKFTHNLIVAEFQSGNYQEAYKLADDLMGKYPSQPFLTDIKSSVLEAMGQYTEAASLLTDFLSTHYDDAFFRVKLAMILYKKSDYKSGMAELDKISQHDDIPIDYQFLIADAYIKGGEPAKGLEIGYKLRLKHYANKTVHQRYIQLQISAQSLDHKVHFPEIVGSDCYVSIKDTAGKSQDFIIVNEPCYPMEVGVTEPFVMEVLGKAVGETFLKGNVTYTVSSIKWKYTHAFHDSMDQIQIRFDNDGPIRVFQFNEGENPLDTIKNIIIPIKNEQVHEKEIEELYKNGQSTIGINANLSGTNPIKYWGKLVRAADPGVFFIGTFQELNTGIRLLNEQSPIVLDIIALLTLYYSNSYPLLAKIASKKYVAQSTLDLINSELEEVNNRKDVPDLIVNEENGLLTKTIVTVEEKTRIIEDLSCLLAEIHKIAQIVHPALPDNYHKKMKMDKMLGQAFHETALIAREKHGLLISDDKMFRQLCHVEQGTPGLSTAGIIQYLIRNGLVSEKDGDIFHEKLVSLNYRFVPMRPQLLIKICQEDECSISHTFKRACDCLFPIVQNEVQVARFVAIFLRLLSLQLLASPSRDNVVQYVINCLFSERPAGEVRKYLLHFLDEQFLLLPNQKAELLKLIKVI